MLNRSVRKTQREIPVRAELEISQHQDVTADDDFKGMIRWHLDCDERIFEHKWKS